MKTPSRIPKENITMLTLMMNFSLTKVQKVSSECQRYLNIPPSNKEVDTIDYWKSQFPNLSRMARDVSPLQYGSVSTERDFSGAVDFITPTRCSLIKYTIQADMCLFCVFVWFLNIARLPAEEWGCRLKKISSTCCVSNLKIPMVDLKKIHHFFFTYKYRNHLQLRLLRQPSLETHAAYALRNSALELICCVMYENIRADVSSVLLRIAIHFLHNDHL